MTTTDTTLSWRTTDVKDTRPIAAGLTRHDAMQQGFADIEHQAGQQTGEQDSHQPHGVLPAAKCRWTFSTTD